MDYHSSFSCFVLDHHVKLKPRITESDYYHPVTRILADLRALLVRFNSSINMSERGPASQNSDYPSKDLRHIESFLPTKVLPRNTSSQKWEDY